MAPDIVKEIKTAQTKGLIYTAFRPFKTKEEHDEFPLCACGEPSVFISYCTIYPSFSSLCSSCMEMELRNE